MARSMVFVVVLMLTDYRLDVCGMQLNLFNRVELSYAAQQFDVPALNTEIEQSITGAKVRLVR